MDKKITAKELARILNISPAAVSYALRGKPGVSLETRNLIKEAADKYGLTYVPLNYSDYESHSIHLLQFERYAQKIVNNTFDNSFYATLTNGILRTSKQYGYHVHMRTVSDSDELSNELSELNNLDSVGIIILATEMHDTDFLPLAFCSKPVVLVDNKFRSSKINSVMINNLAGAYTATDYLCCKYHQMPGFLRARIPLTNFNERFEGYKNALEAHGYSPVSAPILDVSIEPEPIQEEIQALIASGCHLARSYVADNDFLAVGAMRAFRACGYRVPEDIAVVGFDDLNIARFSEPALTTMHVPIEYMGTLAVKRLHEISRFPDTSDIPLKLMVNVNLVTRGSA